VRLDLDPEPAWPTYLEPVLPPWQDKRQSP